MPGMRYQPQVGPLTIGKQCGLLQGAKLLALIVGSNIASNLVDGKPLSIAGTNVKPIPVQRGVCAANYLGQGDLSATGLEAIGGGVFVDFWYGYVYGESVVANYNYLFGDYDGTNGHGLAAHHAGIAGNWGYFDGSALNDSGEALPLNGSLECFVVVRDTVAGTSKVYRNGVLKVTSAGAPVLTSALAVGSLGPNQYSSYATESGTLLAGRLRYKAWDAAAVKSFTNGPWQLFQAPDEEDFVAAAGTAAFAGSAVGVASSAGSLTTMIKLAGAESAATVATAALTTAIALTGAASANGTASAALGTAIKLAGQAAASASSSGALVTGIPLAGNAAASAAASASLTTGIVLTGAAASAATATAALTTTPAGLTGQAVATASSTALLTTGIALAGAGVTVTTGSASLTTTPAGLAGNAAASAIASASLGTAIKLAGAGAAQASASASLGTGAALSGAASAGASATAVLSTAIALASIAQAQTSSSAALSAATGFAGAATASTAATAVLSTKIMLAGIAAAQASASATLGNVDLFKPGNITIYQVDGRGAVWAPEARGTVWQA